MQDVLFYLTWQSSQKLKLVPVARLYSSRELYVTHLAANEVLLCTCRKRTICASTSRKCPHTLPFIHALSRCMDSVQPQTPSVWMECIIASHTRHAECTRIKHVATVSYGPLWAHYLGGYHDRLLGGPLGLPDLRCTVPNGVKHKDYRGEVLG
jgi:hypothetical protein